MSTRTNYFRRWMALFLCLVMCASMFPSGIAFAEGEEETTAGEAVQGVQPEDVQNVASSASEEVVELEPAPVTEAPATEESIGELPAVEDSVPMEPASASEELVITDPEPAEQVVVVEPATVTPATEAPVALEQTVTESKPQETAETEEIIVTDVTGESVAQEAKGANLDTPVLKTAVKSGNGIQITWTPISGATKYRVWRLTSSNTWNPIGDTTASSYTDTNVSNGVSYTYTVTCIDSNGTNVSGYNAAGITCTYWNYAKPTLYNPIVVETGVKVTWSSVGAPKYRVYRIGPSDSGWVALGDVSGTSYTDTQTISGKTYQYTVRAVSSDGSAVLSDYPTGKSVVFYGKSVVKTLTNVVGGVKITWDTVGGVSEYLIQRKLENESWNSTSTKDLTVVTGTTYTDTDVSSGKSYTYRVVCMKSGNVIGTYDANGKSIAFYDAPELTDLVLKNDGVELWWLPVAGATKYRIFRMLNDSTGGTWEAIADVTDTIYLDTDVARGKNYSYTIRCVSSDGSRYISAYDPVGKSITFTGFPVLISAEPIDGAIRVTWDKVQGIKKYRVYRKAEGGNWEKLANPDVPAEKTFDNEDGTTKKVCYYDDKTVVENAGTLFTYTVRCLNDAGEDASWYDEIGVSSRYFPVPKDLAADAQPNGIDVTWKAVTGASGYQVYRKIKDGAWKPVAKVTGTTYNDKESNLTSGVTYYYTVAVLDQDGKIASAYNNTGVEAPFYGAPKLLEIKVVSDGITIKWETVGDCLKYRIYRKTENTSWQKLPGLVTVTAGTKEKTYTDTTVTSGTTYSYTVACAKDATNDLSKYDVVGLTATYYGYNKSPSLKSAINQINGILVSWEPVDGVKTYRVFRREKNTVFKPIADVTGTSYLDTTVNNNSDYFYTVASLSSDGNNISDYDKTGIAVRYHMTPVVKSATNVEVITSGTGKVKLIWEPVPGITKFNIFRKETSKAWGTRVQVATAITGTKESDGNLSFIDNATNMLSGVSYTYTVRCSNDAGTSISDFNSNGKSVLFLRRPVVRPFELAKDGIIVKWTAVDGAEGYRIYRMLDGSNKWDYMASVSGYNNLSWKDKSALSGSKYWYTVRAYKGSTLSGYHYKGLSGTFVDTPVLTSAIPLVSGVQLKWNAVSNASKYEVLRMKEGYSWEVKYTGTATTFTDSYSNPAKENGTRYFYAVRAVAKDGTTRSQLSSMKEILWNRAPAKASIKLTGAAHDTTHAAITVKWNRVEGVTKYRIYRRGNGAPWSAIADVTANSVAEAVYTDKTALYNITYRYTVRSLSNDGKTITSGYTMGDTLKVSSTYFASPTISLSSAGGKVTVTWTSTGAAKYRVFRMLGDSGTWVAIGDVTTSPFVDSTGKIGNTYRYNVRCVSADGSSYTSNYDDTKTKEIKVR